MTRTRTFSAAEVAGHRLARQFLSTGGPATAADVVRALGAVQAQDYAGAKWALAQRMRRATTDVAIEREISEGRILRTHVLRPTWHFVAPEDIRWMLALTESRVKQIMSYYDQVLGLTAAVFRKSNDAIAKALSGGAQLTRAELAQALERAGIATSPGQKLARLVMRAELDAVICSGARRGKQFTYALLDERVPPTAPLERDEALLALARRYFATRGPATIRDFSWWSGLTAADAKRAVDIMKPELVAVKIEDAEAWLVPGARAPVRPTAHLLPNYDEYFIGYKDRSAVGARVGHARAVIGGDGSVQHTAYVDGQLVGQWKRVEDRRRVLIHLRLATRVDASERARLEAAAEAFSAFLGAPVDVRWKQRAGRS